MVAERYNQRVIQQFAGMGIVIPSVKSVIQDGTPFVEFARRVENRAEEVYPGVTLSVEQHKLGDGQFTNVYDIAIDPLVSTFSPKIFSSDRSSYLRRQMIQNPLIKLGLTGGFSFMVDIEPHNYPKDPNDHLCIRNNQVIGLPAMDRAGIMVVNNKLATQPLVAAGTMSIGNQEVVWVGAKSEHGDQSGEAFWMPQGALYKKGNIVQGYTIKDIKERDSLRKSFPGRPVLYNAACATFADVFDPVTPSKRLLVEAYNRTPPIEDGYNVIIDRDQSNALRVTKITREETDFFEGLFILQFHEQDTAKIQEGDPVVPQTVKAKNSEENGSLHDIPLQDITDAVTIGPRIPDEIRYDRRWGRTVIYEGEDGKQHFAIFDAIPESTNFNGPNPRELLEVLKQKRARKAHLLDSGRSGKMGLCYPDSRLEIFGNKHYVRWPKVEGGQYLLNGENGRPMTSFIYYEEVG